MTVVARALELDYDSYSKTDLSAFSDRSEISNWALPYVRAMVGADYIHGRGKVLAPLDNITRAEFAQIFHNIIGTYIVSKGTYDKDIKGSVLIRSDEVTLKDMTVDGDLIIGCGAADGKIVLDNVTVKGRLLVWGGGTKAVYCNAGTNMPAVVVARVDDAVKVIYDRDSTLAVIDTIKVRITERAKQHKETEVIFYDVSGLREAQKQLNAVGERNGGGRQRHQRGREDEEDKAQGVMHRLRQPFAGDVENPPVDERSRAIGEKQVQHKRQNQDDAQGLDALHQHLEGDIRALRRPVEERQHQRVPDERMHHEHRDNHQNRQEDFRARVKAVDEAVNGVILPHGDVQIHFAASFSCFSFHKRSRWSCSSSCVNRSSGS